MQNPQQSPCKFYSRHNLPPVVAAPAACHEVPVYGWDVIDGRVQPVLKGHRDPAADIQAAKQETLTEMLDRMSGRTPLEKVRNAVNAGLIVQDNIGKNAKYADLTGMPDNYLDAHNALEAGKAAADSLPDELKGSASNFDAILRNLTKDQIEAYLAKAYPAPAASSDNGGEK